MGKELARKAGASATETVLQALMPQLLQRLDSMEAHLDKRFAQLDQRFNQIDQRFAQLDLRLDQLKPEFYDKFEQMRDLINELAQRTARLEGRIEGYFQTTRRQDDKIDSWIERLAKLEMGQKSRGRKAS
jgi:flagellar capping protein FliD